MLFIRKNKYVLAMILGIVSMALMVPSITGTIKSIKYFAEMGAVGKTGTSCNFFDGQTVLRKQLHRPFDALLVDILPDCAMKMGVKHQIQCAFGNVGMFRKALHGNSVFQIVVDICKHLFQIVIQSRL